MTFLVIGTLVLLVLIGMLVGALIAGRDDKTGSLFIGGILGFQLWAIVWTVIVVSHFISIYW